MLVPSTVPVSWCNTACIIRVFVRSSYIWYVYFVSDVTTVQPSGYYMYRTVVTICTASLTYSNSTFCPHNVFMCFVWISEQTAIISLYSINWLICITETECVYCAVRTKCYVIQVYFRSSATLSTTKLTLTSSKSRQFMWDLWCTKWHWDKAPPPSATVFICQCHSSDGPHSSSSVCSSYQKDKRAKPGDFHTAMPFRKWGSIG